MELHKFIEIQHGTILSRVRDALRDEKNKLPMLAMQDLSYTLGTNSEKPKQFEYIDPESVTKCVLGSTGEVTLGLTMSKSMVLEENYNEYLIPSNFALLRFDQKVIYPYYLMWYINESPRFHRQVSVLTQGSSVKSLSIRELREIKITLPSYSKQKSIGEVYRLILKRDKLSQLQKDYSLQLIKGITSIEEENNE